MAIFNLASSSELADATAALDKKLADLAARVTTLEKVPPPVTQPPVTQPPVTQPPVTQPPTGGVTGKLGAMWMNIGDVPTDAEIDSLANKYQLIVLNTWHLAQKARIKAKNPACVCLVYQCFASTRSYAASGGVDQQYLPTGVGFAEAEQTDKAWFALDTAGQRIQWSGYAGHWQMAVWNTAYQDRWVANVVKMVNRDGWDGILADNDLHTLKWYSPALMAGTTSQAQSDQKIVDGTNVLYGKAGAALAAAGKLLIPNISESRLRPGRWAAHTKYGGGLEEYCGLWVPQTPNSEFDEMINQTSGWKLIETHTDNVDPQTGYAIAALVSDAKTVFHHIPGAPAYNTPTWIPQQDITLGAPLAKAAKLSNGVWWREFANAYVAVNTSGSAQNVTAWGASRSVPANGSIVLTR